MNAGGEGPHAGQPIERSGAALDEARLALVLFHGRFANGGDMLGLAEHVAPPDVAVIAPNAAGGSWWPDSFLAPLDVNGAGLASAISVARSLLHNLEKAGFGPDRVVLGGFSQGACLALEAAARLARPLRTVVAFSGGLVGTGEAGGPARDDLYGRPEKSFDYSGRLDDVPVLIGCHERDPHIPLARVARSAQVLGALGAAVETIVVPGEGHSIVAGEAEWLRARLTD